MESPCVCQICNKENNIQESVTLTTKGSSSINNFSKSRGSGIKVAPGGKVHIACRKAFTNKRMFGKPLNNDENNVPKGKRSSRSISGNYDSKFNCLFCCTLVDPEISKKHGLTSECKKVMTHEFGQSIMNICSQRKDEWSVAVKGRIEFVSDLYAAECVYHQSCSVNFRTGKQIPITYNPEYVESKKIKKVGRPVSEVQHEAFLKSCDYLETNDMEDIQVTITELIKVMETNLMGKNVKAYSPQYMRQKLIEHFGKRIVISKASGIDNIVSLQESADVILRQYYNKKKDIDIEKQEIILIEAAAKLIKNEIKSKSVSSTDNYPAPDELNPKVALNYLPKSLNLLLSMIFAGNNTELKVASIGQSIMQSARPRSIAAPLQIGLGVQLYHHFRSRYLIDTLHALGFSTSYNNVQLFERNSAFVSSTNLPVTDKSRVIMVADNVDHNVCTLDGRNTIHGMGMIAAISPTGRSMTSVTRRKITNEELLQKTRITILDYKAAKNILNSTVFKDLNAKTNNRSMMVDLVWQISGFLNPTRGQWSGMMQIVYGNEELVHTGKAGIKFLPMIDLNPSDMNCILSTVHFLKELAEKNNVPAVITFDQPLFWKSSIIREEYPDLKSIVLLLGNFHTTMNLLGAIGCLMAGSGLEEVLEEIYAEHTVPHIMSGKAYSRAVRAHLITDSVLTTLLLEDVFPTGDSGEDLKEKLILTYNMLMSGVIKARNLESREDLKLIGDILESTQSRLRETSKTSLLWLEYQCAVSTLRKLITADRVGSFSLLIEALREALPIFASSGHRNYTKSVYLHLQNLLELHNTHPDVHAIFENGGHVIRRSDGNWAGLAPDMIIEQCLMRSLKTNGGLTNGSGMTEIQRMMWLLSMPVYSEYNQAMESFTNVLYESSEQHRDLAPSRVKRDNEDAEKVYNILKPISPYSCEPELQNIVTGVTATEDVNVENFRAIGTRILENMKGEEVFSLKMKVKDKAKTINSCNYIKLPKEEGTVDPALLFQRLYALSSSRDIDLCDVMKYELCAFPPALFESSSIMLKADKPQISKAIQIYMSDKDHDVQTLQQNQIKYVLDGGSLLHRLSWQKEIKYKDIAKMYAEFVKTKYGDATIVFDGYRSGCTIKDMTHKRRSHAKAPSVNFTPEMKFTGKKEVFLSNKENKQRLIDLISTEMEENGCSVVHALDDADVDIVLTAIKHSEQQDTIVIGEDTDLLILLIYWCNITTNYNLLFRSDKRLSNHVYNIQKIRSSLGEELAKSLLALHAYTGCDTTSRIFHVGKLSVFNRTLEDEYFRGLLSSFSLPNLSPDQVEEIGLKLMVSLFNGNKNESMNTCRYKSILSKVKKAKSFVKPQQLPPTESAVKFHSLRAYLQIQIWKRAEDSMITTDWGWTLQDNMYVPQTMDLPAAPETLLKMIRCNCKTPCNSMRCVCKKNGFDCTISCGHCLENNCENSQQFSLDSGKDDENSIFEYVD